MRRRLSLGLTSLAAITVAVVALLALRGSPAQAQPVASIALPAPGNTQQLYAGCNNISLTFPDGTPSQTVVQAVTPPGAVRTLWRFNGPQNRFEGYSPAYPQASDLMSVNFLDAVWFCMTTGAPPQAVAPPTPTPPAQVIPPAPLTVTGADIVPTDLYPDNQPVGVMWVRITNNGPDTLTNNKVAITLSQSRSTFGNPPIVDSSTGPATQYTLNLAPGQTQTINLGAQIDTSHYRYDFTVTAAAVDFTDPNTGNDTYKESVEPLGATLNLTNQSGASIDAVHFTVSGDPWGEDRLMFSEVVANGQTRTWQITAGTYDLRAYIGDRVLDERLNVGISGTYDWTVWAALDIHNSSSFTIGEVYIVPAGWPDWGANLLNPGETIPQYAVRRFNLAPGSYDLRVRNPVNNYILGSQFNAAVAGACAWFVPDNIFTCAP